MKRILLKLLAILWLLVVTPLYGILPLFCLLPFKGVLTSLCYVEMAFLWLLIELFGGKRPAPKMDDDWPLVTPLQLWFMSITVLTISAGALVFLFKKRNNRVTVDAQANRAISEHHR
jgi:hypothetical protein